ncbi:MAG: AraC family transcriptional regulator [Lachnospiraceae bacterium]|nr:AraC family transcriptional regulator [Lachnospiraceae bacterium]MBR3683268.1 AraC family transcriptional regulator [Lachnospiraceae bacterium]
MSTWVEGIQNAIEYMENNLTEEIVIGDVAEKAYVSEFHFQRIFTVLCGYSVGEYIRNRRMALAARELVHSDVKVIDVAMKYGYDSPDSFARAFTKFHGITPSAAKATGAKLRDFAPIRVSLSLEGGTMMEYKIVEKAAFTVMGRKRKFNSETSYQEIPEYWQEHMQDGGSKVVCGMYGVCIDLDGVYFDYLIADNYLPWNEVPERYETRTLPAGLWAVFPCTLKTLQDTNTKMWKEWLPNCKEYKLGGNYNIEMYAPPCEEDPLSSYVELWLPIEKMNL